LLRETVKLGHCPMFPSTREAIFREDYPIRVAFTTRLTACRQARKKAIAASKRSAR
jgi:hypothetical protein